MSYQVLARKWRPRTFGEVIGQEHITRTLQNAILQERVGHAYLFVGPRGIGKTTTARIFAKALNCETGIVSEPCCACQSCLEIAKGSSLDVLEIDGASHNRVEHIRDLRDNVQYTPSRNRYKLYIIDEVHMLTTAAWNALLKTLEEPPAHVKFLFCTTEPHKVLPTIVSRCQRFDLKRIPVPLIVKRLETIATEENIHIEERALAAIARAADGGMRDAQSIFDQMIAFCSGTDVAASIREKDVIDVFGLASSAELAALTRGLLLRDLEQTMGIVQQMADQGRDLERLLGDLILLLRNVMVCAVCKAPMQLLEVSSGELEDLQELSRFASADVVQRILQGLVAYEGTLRAALNKRVYLEATLARVMVEAHSVQLEDVISRLNELRRNGALPGDIGGSGSATARDTRPLYRAPSEADSQRPLPRRLETDVAPPPPGSLRDADAPAADNSVYESTPSEPTQPPSSAEPSDLSRLAGTADQPVAAACATARPPSPTEPGPLPPNPASVADNTEHSRSVPAQEQSDAGDSDPGSLWHKLIEYIGNVAGRQQLKMYMQELRPVSFRDGVLLVAYDEDVPEDHLKTLLGTDNIEGLRKYFRRMCGFSGATVLVKRWIDAVSGEGERPRQVSSAEVRQKVEANAFVQEVCELFEGTVIDVRG